MSKIFAAVFRGFSQQADLDHVENHFPKIFTAVDAPFCKNHLRHRAELRERVFADAAKQFLAADVAEFPLFSLITIFWV